MRTNKAVRSFSTLESSISSAVGNDTASTASLNDVPHNVRMCNFAANTATCVRRLVSIVGDTITIAELRHKAIDRSIVRSVRVGAQKARKMINMTTSESNKRQGFYSITMVSESSQNNDGDFQTYLLRGMPRRNRHSAQV
jgi:hypothetical protein